MLVSASAVLADLPDVPPGRGYTHTANFIRTALLMSTRKWKNELLVNTTTSGNQNNSAVTALADGGFVIAWHDEAGAARDVVRFQKFDAVGNRVGVETTNADDGVGDTSAPALTTLSDGSFWLVQQNVDSPTDHDIEGTVYPSAAAPFARDPNSSSGFDHVAPAIASLGIFGSVAVWQDLSHGNGDIVMRAASIHRARRKRAVSDVDTHLIAK